MLAFTVGFRKIHAAIRPPATSKAPEIVRPGSAHRRPSLPSNARLSGTSPDYYFFALGAAFIAGEASCRAKGVSRKPFSASLRNQELKASFCRFWRT